jgi:uncharacterized protein
MYSGISKMLSNGTFEPLFTLEDIEITKETVIPWCEGFVLGLNLWKYKILSDVDVSKIIIQITILLQEDKIPYLLKEVTGKEYSPVEIEGYKNFLIQTMPELLINLWKYNHPVNKSGKKQIGRNDPCSCGSGKKFKNCCGKSS